MSDSNQALRRSERTKKPAATPNPTESVLKEKSNTKLNESPLDEKVPKNPSASKRKKIDEQSDDENVSEASVPKKIQKNPPVKEKKAAAQKAIPSNDLNILATLNILNVLI